jgi:excisionase family DNA binding protein
VKDALAMIGIGRTNFYELVAAGKIETVKIGRRRLVHMASLKILVSGLPLPPPPSIPAQLPLFAGEEKGEERVLGGKKRGRRPSS